MGGVTPTAPRMGTGIEWMIPSAGRSHIPHDFVSTASHSKVLSTKLQVLGSRAEPLEEATQMAGAWDWLVSGSEQQATVAAVQLKATA